MNAGGEFGPLADALERVRGAASKNEKVRILAEYLGGLSPEDAETAALLAVGRVAERGAADEAQVGYAALTEVIAEACGAGRGTLFESYRRHGDLGEVAQELLGGRAEQTLFPEPLSLADLRGAFGRLRGAKGKGSAALKRGVVKSLLLRATPVEAKYVVKALTGEMRTGLVQGLLEEAVALAFSVPEEDAARGHMLLGDPGAFARRAAEGTMAKVRMEQFRPVNFMLAEPVATAEEAAEHFGKAVYAECKYDGVRAQVHKRGPEVRLYSRRLEDITGSFPEVAVAASKIRKDFVADGEVVPFAEGRPLPFQLLQRRLRRKVGRDEAASKAPVVYFAFDLLLEGSRELFGRPLKERRARLAALIGGSGFRPPESVDVATADEVARAFRSSRERGYEGLVLKDPESPYVMGKRGAGWVKLKEELDTLDVVIVAAEYGHGKRVKVISDYTFAVRDGEELKTIGKAYSGLTDAEIEAMTAKLKSITLEDHGHWRKVRPEVVLEVAFDSIQRSDRHDSGYALRFPRIKRVRADKGPGEADTLTRVEEIFGRQRVKLDDGSGVRG